MGQLPHLQGRLLAAVLPYINGVPPGTTLIDCDGQDTALLIMVAGVVVQGVTFQNCLDTAVRIDISAVNTTTTFIDCHFRSNSGTQGGAVYIGPPMDIDPLVTYGTMDFSLTTFTDCDFSLNEASQGGSAIYVTAGSLTISGGRFTYNSKSVASTSGGAVAVMAMPYYTVVTITGVTFESNGAIGVIGSGGALYFNTFNGDYINIIGTTFLSNQATLRGGAVYLHNNHGSLSFDGVTATSNQAGEAGGFMHTELQVFDMTVNNSTFRDNVASNYGGAFDIIRTTTTHIANSTYTSNRADQGGAINIDQLGDLYMLNCSFDGNRGTFGGAISAARDGKLNLTDSRFTRNAAVAGGAVECLSCESADIQRCLFDQNTAQTGGAASLVTTTESVNIVDCTFTRNAAAPYSEVPSDMCGRGTVGGGGALCLVLQAEANLLNSTFTNNSATNGGALYAVQNCAVLVVDTCASGSANLDSNTALVGNAAYGGGGGAIFALQAIVLNISCGDSYYDTVASGLSFYDFPLWRRYYDEGRITGAMYITGVDGGGCPTWQYNAVYGNGFGPTMATATTQVRLASPAVVTGYSSNSDLLVMLELLDLYNQTITGGTTQANDTIAHASSLASGQVVNHTIGGIVEFTDLRVRQRPGLYNLTFGLDSDLWMGPPMPPINLPTVSLGVRPCHIGEVTTRQNDLCSECSGDVFSFDPANITCDACPANAFCNLTDFSMVPVAGYWHSNVTSVQIHKCKQEVACSYASREDVLMAYQKAVLLGVGGTLNLSQYFKFQCAEGYHGALCAQCQEGYGSVGEHKCAKCPALGLNTTYYLLTFLVAIFIIWLTIHTSLVKSAALSDELATAAEEARHHDGHDDVEGAAAGSPKVGGAGDELEPASEQATDRGGGGTAGGTGPAGGTNAPTQQAAPSAHDGSQLEALSASSRQSLLPSGRDASDVAAAAAAAAAAPPPATGSFTRSGSGSQQPLLPRNRDGGPVAEAQEDEPSPQRAATTSLAARLLPPIPAAAGRPASGRSGSLRDTSASVPTVNGALQAGHETPQAGHGTPRAGRGALQAAAPTPPRTTPEGESPEAHSPEGAAGTTIRQSPRLVAAAGAEVEASEVSHPLSKDLASAESSHQHRKDDVKAQVSVPPAASSPADGVSTSQRDNAGGTSSPLGGVAGRTADVIDGAIGAVASDSHQAGHAPAPLAGLHREKPDKRTDHDDEVDFWDSGDDESERDAKVPESYRLAERPAYAIVLKILISYFQTVTIIRSINISFPWLFGRYLQLSNQATSSVGTMVSLDCSLPQLESMSVATVRTVFNCALPVALIILIVPLWLLIYAIRRHRNDLANYNSVGEYLGPRMIVSVLAIIFYLYPDVTTNLLSIFACPLLDNDVGAYWRDVTRVGSFWSYDYDLKCYSGSHLALTLILGVPGVVLFAFGIPIGTAVFLSYHRRQLDDAQFVTRYGFTYGDYRPRMYYWESVIMARKLGFILVTVFMQAQPLLMQLLVLLAVIVVATLLQLACAPYSLVRMNHLERLSLYLTCFTVYLCTFFLFDNISDTSLIVIGAFLVAVNLLYFLYMAYVLVRELYDFAYKELDVNNTGEVDRDSIQQYFTAKLGKTGARIVMVLFAIDDWIRVRGLQAKICCFYTLQRLRPWKVSSGGGSASGARSLRRKSMRSARLADSIRAPSAQMAMRSWPSATAATAADTAGVVSATGPDSPKRAGSASALRQPSRRASATSGKTVSYASNKVAPAPMV